VTRKRRIQHGVQRGPLRAKEKKGNGCLRFARSV
jgi:hypothetical protein